MRTPLAIAAPVLLLSGCIASYPIQANQSVAPNSTVTITFDSPRDLEARRDATSYTLPAIRTVHGRVEAVRSDTLVLRVLALESRSRQPELPRDARLAVVPDATARLSERRISRGRTAGVVGGMAVIGLLALVLGSMEWEYDCTNC